MGLPIRLETRTGDTPASKRQRQRRDPPDILLTTPEQLALLLASADAPLSVRRRCKRVVLDELHSLTVSKRGDLLSLGLARLFRLAPRSPTIGLSATVAEPDDLRRYLVPQPQGRRSHGRSRAWRRPARSRNVTMLDTDEHLPWAGHSARTRSAKSTTLIKSHKTTLLFVNTRSQAEMDFPGAVAASTTTISPSRCITARSMSRSGARSRTR